MVANWLLVRGWGSNPGEGEKFSFIPFESQSHDCCLPLNSYNSYLGAQGACLTP